MPLLLCTTVTQQLHNCSINPALHTPAVPGVAAIKPSKPPHEGGLRLGANSPISSVACHCRVLLPYVHILIPQAARADAGYGRRDLHAKFRKLKLFLKQRLPEPGLPGSYSTESGLISMPSISTGVHVGSIASWQQQQQLMQRRNSLGLAAPQQQSSSSGAAAATAKIQQEVSQVCLPSLS